MASISSDEVRAVARLARLEIAPDQMERVTREFNAIVEYVSKLSQCPTDGVTPLSVITEAYNPSALNTPLREDRDVPSLSPQVAVDNAPVPADATHRFRVPAILS